MLLWDKGGLGFLRSISVRFGVLGGHVFDFSFERSDHRDALPAVGFVNDRDVAVERRTESTHGKNFDQLTSPFCDSLISEAVLTPRLRGGYAKAQKSGLSLLKSVVPAGGIEPTA